MAVTLFDQRFQSLDLIPGLEYGLMGMVEVFEVMHERFDAAARIEALEHVFAHEAGEVAHRFHGDRLVKQFQRLFIVDAEAAAEGSAVGWETVEQLGVRPADGGAA